MPLSVLLLKLFLIELFLKLTLGDCEIRPDDEMGRENKSSGNKKSRMT